MEKKLPFPTLNGKICCTQNESSFNPSAAGLTAFCSFYMVDKWLQMRADAAPVAGNRE